MTYTLHSFIPGQTIDAVIRLKGRHNYSPAEMELLRAAFNELNGHVVVRAGSTLKVPLEAYLAQPDSEGGLID